MPVTEDLAFNVDEVGIAYGRFRDLRLNSCYQPLYRVEDGFLAPFAVEALAVAFRDGRMINALALFAEADESEQTALKRLCRVLHMRNFENIGIEGLQLFFNADPGISTSDIEHLEWLFGENDIEPSDVVCEITEAVGDDDANLLALADGVRRTGARIAVDDFGSGHSTAARVSLLRPDIVKIDARWFQAVADRPEALAMLPTLFARLRAQGGEILVEGIETPLHLVAALEAGADYLQGFLLARPALAGTIFDEAPLMIDDLMRGPVVPQRAGAG
jgi:EAL domain-containing protein (putative c-di-GMP-specific phosphodiesterase class I)